MSLKIIIRKSNNYNGELGASAIRVNVDAQGQSSKILDSPNMKKSITYFLTSNGWSVYSVSVSKSTATGIFFISAVINAAQNSSSELEKIKQGVGNVLRSILTLSSLSASYAGSAAQTFAQNNSPKTYTIAGTLGDNLGRLGAFRSVGVIKNDVLNHFRSQGWNIQSFDMDWYSEEQQYRFRMYALVNPGYSLNDVKVGATQTFLSARPATNLLENYFNNVRLDANDIYVAPAASSNTNNNTSNNGGIQNPFPDVTSLFNPVAMFGVAGLTIGTVAGVAILFLVLRNR